MIRSLPDSLHILQIQISNNTKMPSKIAQFGLLSLAGSAVAHQAGKHNKFHERRVAQADAPYGMNATFFNSSSPAPPPPAQGTNTLTLTNTLEYTQYLTQYQTVSPSPAASGAISPVVAAEAVSSAPAEVCEEVTVTVTNKPKTVTVTQWAAASSAAPATSSVVAASSAAAVSSVVPAVSPSSVAPVASSYAAPSSYVAPSSVAPSSVAPVSSSAATFAESSAAPATSAVITSTPASSSVASSTPAATQTASSGSVAKRGLVYNDFSVVTDFESSSAIGWAWNWGQTSGGSMPTNIQYVPTLWGTRETDDLATWFSNAQSEIANGAKYLMAFNEPDVEQASGGSDISPADAATAFKTYMNPYAANTTLVSPGVCNGVGTRTATGRSQGLDWMTEFKSACGGFGTSDSQCKISALNIHWYNTYTGDVDTNIANFKSYAKQAYEQFQMPIWITEFALSGADDTSAKTFLEAVFAFAAENEWLERYSFFKGETLVASTVLKTLYAATS